MRSLRAARVYPTPGLADGIDAGGHRLNNLLDPIAELLEEPGGGVGPPHILRPPMEVESNGCELNPIPEVESTECELPSIPASRNEMRDSN
jgi:hypothetical protein